MSIIFNSLKLNFHIKYRFSVSYLAFLVQSIIVVWIGNGKMIEIGDLTCQKNITTTNPSLKEKCLAVDLKIKNKKINSSLNFILNLSWEKIYA